MVSTETFEWLTAWLARSVSACYSKVFKGTKYPNIEKFGLCDKAYQAWREIRLMEALEKAICGGTERYILWDDSCLRAFNGKWFEPVKEGRVFLKELIKQSLRLLNIGPMYISKIAKPCAAECVDRISSVGLFRYEPDKRYISFNNCILDTKTDKLHEHSVKYRAWIRIDFDYVPMKALEVEFGERYGIRRGDNPGRIWDDILDEIIPNKQFQSAFQQWCGALLLDEKEFSTEKACFLFGNGGNGKTVLAEAIAGCFRVENFSRFTPQQQWRDSDAKYNIAAMNGKMCNLGGDIDPKDFSTGGFKNAVSRKPVEARVIAGNPFQVVPPPQLFCCNRMPKVSDNSDGFWDRLLVIITTRKNWRQEGSCDPNLSFKLGATDIRRYIFNWVYEGMKKVRANNGRFTFGAEVREAVQMIMGDCNALRAWWRERGYYPVRKSEVSVGDKRWRKLRDLYKDYLDYISQDPQYSRGDIASKNELKYMLNGLGCAQAPLNGYPQYCVGQSDMGIGEERIDFSNTEQDETTDN